MPQRHPKVPIVDLGLSPGVAIASRRSALRAIQPELRRQEYVPQHRREFDEWSPSPQANGPAHLGPEPPVVHQPAGDVLIKLLHPQFTIAEELYRKLPEEAFYSPRVDPRHPVQFEIGAFKVPENQQLWLMDYEFSLWRFSGVDPSDIIKAADSRFSGQVGWDIVLDLRREAHLRYELDPTPISVARQAFSTSRVDPRVTQAAFDNAAANSFASTASPGLSLLPVRPNVQGARNMPFTLIATENTTVALNCVIFRPLTTPIAAVQGIWSGYLVQEQLGSSLIERVRPR